jgi:hypothetical protein
MFRTPILAALTLLVAAPSLPQPAARHLAAERSRTYQSIERIRWTNDDESFHGDSSRQLRFIRDRSNSSISAKGDPEVERIIDTIANSEPGQDIAFSLAREAGTLACAGKAEDGARGSGTCRFDPNDRYAAELARRGIAPDDSDDMMGLTLVDAHLATVDALTSQGLHFGDAGELIAVSALGVTPSYANDLRQAGLHIDAIGDLIAARALKIDAQWLGEMAQAGYPHLEVGKAIQMRALGVTPDYAMKMARVLRTVGEIQ